MQQNAQRLNKNNERSHRSGNSCPPLQQLCLTKGFSWKIGLANTLRSHLWRWNRDLELSLSESKAGLFIILYCLSPANCKVVLTHSLKVKRFQIWYYFLNWNFMAASCGSNSMPWRNGKSLSDLIDTLEGLLIWRLSKALISEFPIIFFIFLEHKEKI